MMSNQIESLYDSVYNVLVDPLMSNSRSSAIDAMIVKPISIAIDPNKFPYVNVHSNSLESDVKDTLWRLHGRDEANSLSENSWIKKFSPNENDLEEIKKQVSFQDGMGDYLGINNFVNRVNPLYGYSRFIPKLSVPSLADQQINLASDKLTMLMMSILEDKNYQELDSEEKKAEAIKQIIDKVKYGFCDQLNESFHLLQSGQYLYRPNDMYITFIEPSIQGFSDMTGPKNLLLKRTPFQLGLNSAQFRVTIENKIDLYLNYRFLDVTNLFDLMYGALLLKLAGKVSKLETNKIYLYSPMLYVDNSVNGDLIKDKKIKYYNLEITKPELNDFSDIGSDDIVCKEVI